MIRTSLICFVFTQVNYLHFIVTIYAVNSPAFFLFLRCLLTKLYIPIHVERIELVSIWVIMSLTK